MILFDQNFDFVVFLLRFFFLFCCSFVLKTYNLFLRRTVFKSRLLQDILHHMAPILGEIFAKSNKVGFLLACHIL